MSQACIHVRFGSEYVTSNYNEGVCSVCDINWKLVNVEGTLLLE